MMLRVSMRLAMLAAIAVGTIGVLPSPGVAQAPPKPRTQTEIWRSIEDNGVDLGKLGWMPLGLLEKAKRDTNAPLAIPLLKKRMALWEELARAQGNATGPGDTRYDQLCTMSMLVAFNDDEAKQGVAAVAKRNTLDGYYAKLCQNLAGWYDNAGNATEQARIVETMRAFAKLAPLDETLARICIAMAGTAASKDVGAAMEDVIVKELKGATATLHKNIPKVDKPLTISGTTVRKEAFSTARWKGKVVLVHFWAIQDYPASRTAHNDLKEVWKKYHDKGLEIVGVLSAAANDSTSNYLAERGFVWPELLDPRQPGWHPLIRECDVGMNTVFLIDRNGVLRSRNALKDLEEILPPLLEEKVETVAKVPATTRAGKP